MRFYPRRHEWSCGIDLHARTMYLCVLDRDGRTVLHRNLPCRPEALLRALEPFRGGDLVVGCECLFAWYWLADLCENEGIPFVLGHALAMRAIHGLKTKSDKLDSWKIAQLLHDGGVVYFSMFRMDYSCLFFDGRRSELQKDRTRRKPGDCTSPTNGPGAPRSDSSTN